MIGDPQLPSFDGDNWVKVARIAVAISAALWTAMAAVLMFAAAPNQCPSGHLKDAHSTSLWLLLFLWGGPLNIFGCFIVLRWNWAIQKSIERETDFRSPQVPVTHVLVRMCVANSVVSQLPLFFLLTKCTPMLGPGG
jgi:hypothetical protein